MFEWKIGQNIFSGTQNRDFQWFFYFSVKIVKFQNLNRWKCLNSFIFSSKWLECVVLVRQKNKMLPFRNPEKCMILTKNSALPADDMRKYVDDTRTTCQRHITCECGPKSRKKNLGRVKIMKKNWGGSNGNIFFFCLTLSNGVVCVCVCVWPLGIFFESMYSHVYGVKWSLRGVSLGSFWIFRKFSILPVWRPFLGQNWPQNGHFH
jgi:hypothetical protein